MFFDFYFFDFFFFTFFVFFDVFRFVFQNFIDLFFLQEVQLTMSRERISKKQRKQISWTIPQVE